MRKMLLSLVASVGLLSSPGLAQIATSPGQALDIRNSDMGSHDSLSTPDLHDQLLKQRSRELSDRLQARSKLGPARPAKQSELAAGAPVNDNTGVAIAKIDQIDPDGIVLSMGRAKVKVPAEAFGHNKAGLLLDMTKAQFEQVVAKANAS